MFTRSISNAQKIEGKGVYRATLTLKKNQLEACDYLPKFMFVGWVSGQIEFKEYRIKKPTKEPALWEVILNGLKKFY